MSFETTQVELADAVDLSQHLSTLAKSRRNSPLKTFAKYMFDPTQRSLAGGLPHPGFFPFETIGGQVLTPEAYLPAGAPQPTWLSKMFSAQSWATKISTPKYPKNPGDMNLAVALQYGGAAGMQKLPDFLKEFVSTLYKPAYKNWDVLLNDGSTDGFNKVIELLTESGDGILVESFTYPSAIETAWPHNVRPVPITIDNFGLVPEALEKVLKEWDVKARGGMRRPRVLYTVPVGQNPTGSTISPARKKAIYKLAVEYDFIIIEDDPYYFLQAGSYPQKLDGPESDTSLSEEEKNAAFIAGLSPTYLSMDTEGRVIRIETFSKTVAPGCRLGFFVTNPLFTERLTRATEVSTQQPSGPIQVLMTALIVEQWGMSGWLRWLRGLRGEYGRRRDWMVSELLSGFPTDFQPGQQEAVVSCFGKAPSMAIEDSAWNEKMAVLNPRAGLSSAPLLAFLPPTAGMFVWVKIDLSHHISLRGMNVQSESFAGKAADVMQDLWTDLAEHKVLLGPGWMFSPYLEGKPDDKEDFSVASGESDVEPRFGYFRMSFATLEEKAMRTTVKDFCDVVKAFFA